MQLDLNQLKTFLLDSGLVSKKDIALAEEKAKNDKTSIGEVLLAEGKVLEDDYRRMEAYLLGIPFVDLKNQKIDFDTLSIIPEPVARNHNIVIFKKTTTELEAAMLDPHDLEAIEFIQKKTGLRLLPRLTDKESIKHALLQYQKSLKAEFGDIIQKEAISLKTLTDAD